MNSNKSEIKKTDRLKMISITLGPPMILFKDSLERHLTVTFDRDLNREDIELINTLLTRDFESWHNQKLQDLVRRMEEIKVQQYSKINSQLSSHENGVQIGYQLAINDIKQLIEQEND